MPEQVPVLKVAKRRIAEVREPESVAHVNALCCKKAE